jgi:large subunit ribosomal protein L4
MQVPVYNMAGEKIQEIELREDIFGVPVNEPVMHQSLLRQLANARLGTADTKTRGEVTGGGKKPWRQKGTGRARQGTTRAPNWRGGGVVFGPHPRSYEQKMPKKMRQLALKSALSSKVSAGQIVLVDQLSMDVPKTKDFVQVLGKLSVRSSTLVLLPEQEMNVEKSARNLPYVKTLRVNCLNVADILGYDYLLLSLASLQVIETIWG